MKHNQVLVAYPWYTRFYIGLLSWFRPHDFPEYWARHQIPHSWIRPGEFMYDGSGLRVSFTDRTPAWVLSFHEKGYRGFQTVEQCMYALYFYRRYMLLTGRYWLARKVRYARAMEERTKAKAKAEKEKARTKKVQ